ncbi:hypothetical protein [Roseateles violae]|uniref:Uncharacterized protein n=1 Tax=Roseateles violae TaxID=3058042 RepID=A0ABT8DZQ8_9BURK|nr:hypothetical protein [Pelomonas sp. PFR6]MDN3923088.1 hypothetical protein [Pelomonas sp. PFR6]
MAQPADRPAPRKRPDSTRSATAAQGDGGPKRAPPGDQDWLNGVQAALERVAAQAREPDAAAQPAPAPPPSARAAQAARPAVDHAMPAPAPVRGSAIGRYLWPALIGALGGAALAAAGWWWLSDRQQPQQAETGASAPQLAMPTLPAPALPPPPPPPPAPKPARVEPGLALIQALAPLPLLDLREAQPRVNAQLAAPGPARLALLRQDALRALPRTRALAGTRLVAPLFTEPLQIWVRADSSLRGLRDLDQAVIDTGPAAGDAQTAAHLMRALSGRRAAARPMQRQMADDEALIALLGREVDALFRVRASDLTVDAAAAAGSGTLRALSLQGRPPPPGYSRLADGGLGLSSFLLVAGGTAAERERLAAQAMGRLCAALPALRDVDALNWSAVRPEIARPAGRPYADSLKQARAACRAARA